MHDRSTAGRVTDAAANLSIYTLGPPDVRWERRSLLIARRQARAMLYCLAVHLRPVPREQLCFLFWPDVPESSARRNLTRLLSHLRRALPVPALLVASGDYVGLEPDRIWSDAVAFERLCETSNGQERTEALQQAVDLYRGPFLDGFSLPGNAEIDAWASSERRGFERLYLQAASALIEEYTFKGAYENAIALAQRYLATDDLAESVHRRLIELYAATGDRGAASRQFERCVTILEQELGVSPLPETWAVYQAALEGRPAPELTPLFRPQKVAFPDPELPLVGRQGALDQLEQAYAQAQSGHGGFVLLSGEAGVGKSRLLHEFVTLLQNRALALTGAGQSGAQSLPYHPLTQALRTLLVHSPTPPLPRPLAPIWLAEASRLLPELRAIHPDLPPPLPGGADEARARLFEALCQIVFALSDRSRPALLCLDDLHWADRATLDWLGYLGPQLREKPLLVIGTCRAEDLEGMSGLCHSLRRSGTLTELSLKGLDVPDVAQLVCSMIGDLSAGEPLSRRLQQATGGNPFFLIETLRVILETGPREDLTDLPLTDSVRQTIGARLSRLDPVARQVLEAAAVLGLGFDFDPLAQAAGRGEAEALGGLETLVARQLLVERPDGYRFRHELIQTAVYRDLNRWRRRLLHRRAGEALERTHPQDPVALAWHFERAEEPDKAARYALAAGEKAKTVFAYADAQALFDRALTLLQGQAAHLDEPALAVNRRLQIQALHGRGWALRLLGDMAAFECDSQHVAQLVEQLDDPPTLAHLRWREAYSHRWFCRYAQAARAASKGLRLAQTAGDVLLEAMCRREIGLAAREAGAYRRAQIDLETALDLFTQLGDVVYQVHTLTNLSTLHRHAGECAQAMKRARQALVLCEQEGLSLERRLPLGDMGATAAECGDHDTAQLRLQESLAIARQIADRTQEIFCQGHLGWLYVRLDRPNEALEHLEAALNLAERIGSCAEQSWLHAGLAQAHHLAGHRETATSHARRALELAQATERACDSELARQIWEATREVEIA